MLESLKARDILGGILVEKYLPELKDTILIAVTEMNPLSQLDTFATAMQEVLAGADKNQSGAKEKVLTV